MSFIGRRRDRPLTVEVFQMLEKKGGEIALNIEESLAEVTRTYTEIYVLKKAINISTPTPPSGITVYKYALLVSFATRIGGTGSWLYSVRVDVDDVTLVELTNLNNGSYVYYDRAQEVSSGAHTVKFYLKTAIDTTAYLKDARANCGIGTVSTALAKVVDIVVAGDSKALVQVAGRSYEADYTATAEVRADESVVEKTSVAQSVTKGGTLYQNYSSLTTFLYQMLGYYVKTSNANSPAFLTYSEDKSIRMVVL